MLNKGVSILKTKMTNNYIAQGILFYSSIYVSSILVSITLLTGRWVFLFFILLNLALVAYMSYLTAQDSEHLKTIGKWAEDFIASTYNSITHFFSKRQP